MYKRNQVFAAACIGLFLFGIMLITLGSILPALMAKFEDGRLNAGTLVSVLPIGIITGSLVFGPIVDRYGYKILLIVSILISAIALEGLAFTRSPFVLHVCIFLFGLAGGAINGGTNALVADISMDNKAASLSLLGVSFGIGALGMPLVLGILSERFGNDTILSVVGLFMFLSIIFFLLVKFPIPKQAQGFPIKQGVKLLKEPSLLLMGFFLFFQSGAEALINNWTTTYFQGTLRTSYKDALYALSLSLVGLTVARLLLGGILKKMSSIAVLIASLLLVAVGSFILMYTGSYGMAVSALVLCGAGLAAGFPVILGYVGQLYTSLSGTAFSIALVIALIGNTIINYIFGIIVNKYTVGHLPLLLGGCIICLIILSFLIRRKIGSTVKL